MNGDKKIGDGGTKTGQWFNFGVSVTRILLIMIRVDRVNTI